MGMAGQIEGVARFICIVGNFGGMYEGDAEFAGMIGQRRLRGIAVERVHVIEPGDAQALALALKDERAIDQHVEAHSAERIGHLDRIVIAEHRDPLTAHPNTVERRCHQPGRSGNRRVVVAVDVAGQGEQIDFEAAEQRAGGVDKRRKDVEMGVAHMKDSVSVELSRQLPECERQLDQLEIEGIALPLFMERCEAETCSERAEETGEQPFAPAGAAASGADPVPAVLQEASLNGPIGTTNESTCALVCGRECGC